MNREIKFRGKSKEPGCEGKWVTGYFFKDKKDGYMILGGEPQYGWFNHRIEEETLGEYIGLKDKNNKEIWEDDLRIDEKGVVFRIYSTIGGFVFKAHYWKEDCRGLVFSDELILLSLTDPQNIRWLVESTKHIGNIHDNPELLKQREG